MFRLFFYHSYNAQDVETLRDWLLGYGFEENDTELYAINLEKKTMAGYDPDWLLVLLNKKFVDITADYAEYRDKQTITDPEHPFKE